ncbi:hypothetical protein J2741_001559 [Methanolinea mesophila]|uniref:hypothetical protein n=1 Tax=Methanolinea mesophila TaxID=547055 RepID=UPI001AE50093|nr:hypothetical protein [Methanolinea mesophila]MBP1929012.1 hypothetical protein [Methanolinea mesophila]
MFTIKKIILLTAIALVLCTFGAMADTGVPQVPETQGFSTSTAISALGTVTETDSVVNIVGSLALNLPIPAPLTTLYIDQTEYVGTYTENTIADQGLVTYTKGMSTDTSGMATENLFNVHTDKVVEFVGTDTGRMTSDENSVIDGAATSFLTQSIMICPFAAGQGQFNAGFCNIVQEGSSVDLTLGSLATTSDQRYIMKKSASDTAIDVPVSDPGVESDYSIKLTGFGDVPAMGSAEAYIDVHVQEGRSLYGEPGPGIEPLYPKAEDLVYSETTTASGDITLFQKVMNYNSKITSPGVFTPPT